MTWTEREELVERARRFRMLAADLVVHRDPEAADRHFNRALGLFPDDDPDRLPVPVRAAWAAMSDGQADQTVALLTKATIPTSPLAAPRGVLVRRHGLGAIRRLGRAVELDTFSAQIDSLQVRALGAMPTSAASASTPSLDEARTITDLPCRPSPG